MFGCKSLLQIANASSSVLLFYLEILVLCIISLVIATPLLISEK